ncbi:hypothetical protein VTL71DRAFT_1767 [Oculimacula yallundae]|uniref:Uncharacterized protein n=1 Tax=Oculimacula yallundae TaxID=86028 RepID=A0ABR4CBM3_9HELO
MISSLLNVRILGIERSDALGNSTLASLSKRGRVLCEWPSQERVSHRRGSPKVVVFGGQVMICLNWSGSKPEDMSYDDLGQATSCWLIFEYGDHNWLSALQMCDM